jgi:4-hydroxy-tetrahydrodipicolinate synthase
MEGTGVPLVTPFDDEGQIDTRILRRLVSWVTEEGVDFVVPCGSNGESELLTLQERARVIETVVDEASVPVLAGTGHPGLVETRKQTALAAESGVDGALVVTPYYYRQDQAALESYYRRLADAADVPVYLYSVPAKTGVSLDPETVARLSEHDNIHGMKDSSGDMVRLTREHRLTDADFDLFIGNGSLYAQGLDVGIRGGILALANVVPGATAEIFRMHRDGETAAARRLNGDLVDLNQAVTERYGVPGVKAAMRMRGAPAGSLRSPHRPVDDDDRREIQRLVSAVAE